MFANLLLDEERTDVKQMLADYRQYLADVRQTLMHGRKHGNRRAAASMQQWGTRSRSTSGARSLSSKG
jgi:hypothetical protein